MHGGARQAFAATPEGQGDSVEERCEVHLKRGGDFAIRQRAHEHGRAQHDKTS